jgi:hypothetical protein
MKGLVAACRLGGQGEQAATGALRGGLIERAQGSTIPAVFEIAFL